MPESYDRCTSEVTAQFKKKGLSEEKAKAKAIPICVASYKKTHDGKSPLEDEKQFSIEDDKIELKNLHKHEFSFEVDNLSLVDDKFVDVIAMQEGEFEYKDTHGDGTMKKTNICGDCLKASVKAFDGIPAYVDHQRTNEDKIGVHTNPRFEVIDGVASIVTKLNLNSGNKRMLETTTDIKNKNVSKTSTSFGSVDIQVPNGDYYSTHITPYECSVLKKTKPVCNTCEITDKKNFSKKEVKNMEEDIKEIKKDFSIKLDEKDNEIEKLNLKIKEFSLGKEKDIKELEEVKKEFSKLKETIETEKKNGLVTKLKELSMEKGLVPKEFVDVATNKVIEDKFVDSMKNFSVEKIETKIEVISQIPEKIKDFGIGLQKNDEENNDEEIMKQNAKVFYGENI